ncbi:MAG: cytochrome c oxidase subunit II [Gammaproteobacteria bacterium]
MSVIKTKTSLLGVATLLSVFFTGAAWATDYGLNLPKGVTSTSHEVYDLHMLVLWICVVIGVGVFGVMFWSFIYHRKSKGAVAAHFHHNTKAEFIWTIIPVFILVGMAIPATIVLKKMYNVSDSAMTIKVTGYQWRWRYDYVDQGFGFFSSLASESSDISKLDSGKDPNTDPEYLREVDHPLVLPVNEKIRILTTGADVIHSWWVPDLGWKKDAIPGFINQSWTKIDKPGVYRGQCAELCGKGHAYMPIVVKAVSQSDYKEWVKKKLAEKKQAAAGAKRTWSKDELMKHGKQVFESICAACHQKNGLGVPGAFPPLAGGHKFSASQAMLKRLEKHGFYKDGKIVLGPVPKHMEIVLNGITGTAMQAFGKQLNDVQLAAVITYERNSFGNDTGDVIQPADIEKAKKASSAGQ